MGTRSRSSRKTKRSGHSNGRGRGALINVKALKQIIRLGITGMVAMYVATILVNIGAVSTVAGRVAKIIGISKESVIYAAKGTGVAAIALRLHKELEKL